MAQAVTVARGGEVLSERAYARLLKDVTALIRDGRVAAERQVATVLARTYWEVGARVVREQLSERAGYGSGLLRELSRDLGVGERTLQRAVQFVRVYPDGPRAGLSWAHYQELLRVAEPKRRGVLEVAALEGEWSRRRLSEEIRALKGQTPRATRRGKGGLPRPTDAAYVYRCWVEHVVDGDTLVVQLDLGFEVIRRQRVRLAGVNVQEVGAQERQGYRYVLTQLGKAASVVVKTTRLSDAYGRYVGYVFYSTDEGASVGDVFEGGRFLNGELIEAGLGEQVPVE